MDYGPDPNFSTNRRRAFYIICCLAIIWPMAALRDVSWGASKGIDTANYAWTFGVDRTKSWVMLYNDFSNRYLYGLSDDDIGYHLLGKIIGLFVDDYNIFSLIIDSLFFVPFGVLLYRYTTTIRQIVFGFIFYTALVQSFLFAGARQVYALGLDIAAIMYMMEEKRTTSIVFFLIGTTIHLSSLLTIGPLVIIWLDINSETIKTSHKVSLMLAPIVFMLPNQVISFMGGFINTGKYSYYGANAVQGGANTFILLSFVLTIFSYISFSKKRLSDSQTLKYLYTTVPFMTMFSPLIRSNGSMIRIALYFYIYQTIIFPLGIDCLFTRRMQRLIYWCSIALLTFLIIYGHDMSYRFMWETAI